MDINQKLTNIYIEKAKLLAEKHDSKLIECSPDTIGEGLNAIYDMIEDETKKHFQYVSIDNYSVLNPTGVIVMKLHYLTGNTMPLIVIFHTGGKDLELVTELQMYCGHESKWSIEFQD